MTPSEREPLTELLPPGDLNPRREAVLDFHDRPFGELSPADYAALGFMAGLEVHQQLLTRRKLFCRCPAGVYTRDYDSQVLRHMRPTLSELGVYDGTALMEFKTRKEIVYRLHRANVCTYEIDDTPPFPIDEEAIRIALEVCLLFDLSLVSELHVMRKQYLDGSIPTGFQRTAMMGVSGAIPFRVPDLGVDRMLHIRQLSLEEDACREVSDEGHRITFLTDRLGMPLTEVVTEPEMLTPLELQAGARLVARVTRECARTRRGVGAARQDVNVSVAGGRRVEIKGVGRHRGLPLLVHNEATRQLNLLRIRDELHRRGVTPEALSIQDQGPAWEVSPLVVDATSLLRETALALLGETIEEGGMALAVRLPEFRGILSRVTQPGVAFAQEVADRVRVIACLTSSPFLLHSDGGDAFDVWPALRGALHAGPHDAIVLVWGSKQDAETAAREILIRAREALDGVPPETRQSFPDGTTGFERILPGADRMYPDTDTPPFPIPDAWVDEIRPALPEKLWHREARYAAMGVAERAASRLAASPWRDLFEALDPEPGALAARLAHALEKRLPPFFRRGGMMPAPNVLAPLIEAIEGSMIRPEALEPALDRLLDGDPMQAVVEQFGIRGDEEVRLANATASVVLEARDLRFSTALARDRWAMGRAMADLLGRIHPAVVHEALRSVLDPVTVGESHV